MTAQLPLPGLDLPRVRKPAGPWLGRRDRPQHGQPVRWLGQDGARLRGVASDRGLIATHRDGKRLRAPVEFAFGQEWPDWEGE